MAKNQNIDQYEQYLDNLCAALCKLNTDQIALTRLPPLIENDGETESSMEEEDPKSLTYEITET